RLLLTTEATASSRESRRAGAGVAGRGAVDGASPGRVARRASVRSGSGSAVRSSRNVKAPCAPRPYERTRKARTPSEGKTKTKDELLPPPLSSSPTHSVYDAMRPGVPVKGPGPLTA